MDRLVDPLQLRLATLSEPDAFEASGEMNDLPAREHFAGACERAEPPGDIQRCPAEAPLDGHGLTRVEPYPDGERMRWIGDRLLDEPLLQGNGPADRRARRAEHDQGLVATQLDHPTVVILDQCPDDSGEASREACTILVAPLLREHGVAADVGDQERVDICVPICVRLGLRSISRLNHGRRPAIRWHTHPPSMDPLLRRREPVGQALPALGSTFTGGR